MISFIDGGPAFPVTPSYDEGVNMAYSGMSLRDYFAAAAMRGILAGEPHSPEYEFEDGSAVMEGVAINAYRLADAMLKARDGETGK